MIEIVSVFVALKHPHVFMVLLGIVVFICILVVSLEIGRKIERVFPLRTALRVAGAVLVLWFWWFVGFNIVAIPLAVVLLSLIIPRRRYR